MDIDLLSKMVKELILDNDMVVLPGLGAFVAEMVPSTFTDKGFTINPPYRRLYFRSKPDDGTELADFYALSNGVSKDVADKVIRDFITDLKAVLLIRKAVVFPGLGRLRATRENAVFFVADEDLDIYPEGFGLESVSLKTHQETKEEVRAVISELKSVVEQPPVVQEPSMPVVQPEPEANSASEAKLEPEVISGPEVIAEPEPEPEIILQPEMEPVIMPLPEPDPDPQPVDMELLHEDIDVKMNPKTWVRLLRTLLWILAAAVVLLAFYVIVSRMFPNVFDHILYTKEELEILYSQL